MKQFFTLAAFAVISFSLCAQKEIRNVNGSYFKQCSHFEISKPLWQLAKEHPAEIRSGEHRQAADAKRKFPWMSNSPTVLTQDDPVVQKTQGTVLPENTLANFDGTPSALGYDPLDPTGMVGPNHFVQCVNSNYQVFDKSGAALTGMVDLATLFPNSTDDGDPIVLYDKFADRWFISEFQSKPAGGNENELLIAISQTNDPTGSYYLYTFEPDTNDFADYPKFSIWADGYYETCNCDYQKVTVYERTKMLTGDTTAGFIVIPSVASPNNNFFCPQTLFADGQLPPYGSPEYLFFYTDDNWGSPFSDRIYIYKVTANWTNKTGTLAPFDSLSPQPFNSYFTGGSFNDISQPGTTSKLDALDGFFGYRIPYIRWSNYNAAVMCHPVNTGSLVAGVRWYELRQDTTTSKWSIFQQGTYAPADGVSRWNAAIGMDMNGSIGLAYSVSASTGVFPGIRYTGRNACDSLGIMSAAETVAIAGASAWTSDNRWGDYSHTSLDPADGITFWHTNQYIGAGNSLNTRIFAFQVPLCGSGVLEAQNSFELHAWQSENSLNIYAKGFSSDKNIEIGLYNSQGALVSRKLISSISNSVETTLNVFGIAKGIYYVRLLNENFQRTVKVSIQ